MGHQTDSVRPGRGRDGRRFYSIVGLLACAVLILCVAVIGIARSRFADERLRIAFRDTLAASAPSSTISFARSGDPKSATEDSMGPSLPYTESPSDAPSSAPVARATREAWTITDPTVVSRGSQQVFVDGTAVVGRVIKARALRAGSETPCEFWIELSTYLPNDEGPGKTHLYELTGFWEIVPQSGTVSVGHGAIRGRLSGKYASDPMRMEHLKAEVMLLVPAVEGNWTSGHGEFVGSGRFAGRLFIPRPLASPGD